jgi:hypothetical protein
MPLIAATAQDNAAYFWSDKTLSGYQHIHRLTIEKQNGD